MKSRETADRQAWHGSYDRRREGARSTPLAWTVAWRCRSSGRLRFRRQPRRCVPLQILGGPTERRPPPSSNDGQHVASITRTDGATAGLSASQEVAVEAPAGLAVGGIRIAAARRSIRTRPPIGAAGWQDLPREAAPRCSSSIPTPRWRSRPLVSPRRRAAPVGFRRTASVVAPPPPATALLMAARHPWLAKVAASTAERARHRGVHDGACFFSCGAPLAGATAGSCGGPRAVPPPSGQVEQGAAVDSVGSPFGGPVRTSLSFGRVQRRQRPSLAHCLPCTSAARCPLICSSRAVTETAAGGTEAGGPSRQTESRAKKKKRPKTEARAPADGRARPSRPVSGRKPCTLAIVQPPPQNPRRFCFLASY